MFNTTPPRRVLKLVNKKSSTNAVAHKKFQTYHSSGQDLNCRRPQSLKDCQLPTDYHRNGDAVDRVGQFEASCREFNGRNPLQFSNLLRKNLNGYIKHEGKHKVQQEIPCQNISVKINVIGSPRVGKTSLIQRLAGHTSPRKNIALLDGLPIEVTFHETDIRLQREIPHRDSDAFLLVYSLEDRRSLSVVAQIVRQMRYKYKITSPIFLVANKMDLVRNQSLTKEDGKLLAREHKCKYSETSLVQENDLDAFIITILQGIAVEDELYSDIEYRNNEIESKKKKHKGPILRLLSKLSKCYSS